MVLYVFSTDCSFETLSAGFGLGVAEFVGVTSILSEVVYFLEFALFGFYFEFTLAINYLSFVFLEIDFAEFALVFVGIGPNFSVFEIYLVDFAVVESDLYWIDLS